MREEGNENLLHKADVNFFKALESSKVVKKGNMGNTIGGIVLVVLVCSINLVMYIYLDYSNKQTNIEIDKYFAYMTDSTNLENQKKYQEIKAEVEAIKKATEGIKILDDKIEGLEQFNLNFYNRVMLVKPERVEITDIIFTSEILEIRCTTKDNSPPADYALALDDSGIFEKITYEGFQIEGGETGQALRFSIQCAIKRGDKNEN